MKWINLESGDVISSEIYNMLSAEARRKFTLVKEKSSCEDSMSLGEGIATTAAIVVLSPVILLKGLGDLFS